MNRRDMLFALSISLVLLATLSIQAFTTAQRPRGPGRFPPEPMMMVDLGLPLENSWAYVCFRLGVTEQQLSELLQAYREAWEDREYLREQLRASRDDPDAMRTLRAEMERIRSALHGKLRAVLTPDQMKDLLRWEREIQYRRPRPPRRR